MVWEMVKGGMRGVSQGVINLLSNAAPLAEGCDSSACSPFASHNGICPAASDARRI